MNIEKKRSKGGRSKRKTIQDIKFQRLDNDTNQYQTESFENYENPKKIFGKKIQRPKKHKKVKNKAYALFFQMLVTFLDFF